MKIHINLGRLLDERRLSQHKISEMTGIRQPTINAMCRNQTSQVPLKNLASLCEVLECEISDILELKKEQSD